MPQVTISEAARLAGKNRKTIQRAVADGRLSMSQDVAGERGIEISELIRVFGELSHPSPATGIETMSQPVQSHVAPNVAALEARIEGLEAVVLSKDETISNLTGQVDELRQEKRELRAQVAGLLEDRRAVRAPVETTQPPPPAPAQTNIWTWITVGLAVGAAIIFTMILLRPQ